MALESHKVHMSGGSIFELQGCCISRRLFLLRTRKICPCRLKESARAERLARAVRLAVVRAVRLASDLVRHHHRQ
jgi:hypothetical protein